MVCACVCSDDDLKKAVAGCWAVFHVASPNPLSKNKQLFWDVNVNGTEKILKATEQAGLPLSVPLSLFVAVFISVWF